MKNLINLDIEKMKESLREHHKQYDFPVKDITAENILVKFFESNNYKVLSGKIINDHPFFTICFACTNDFAAFILLFLKTGM